ncbi:hypothetical protein O181_115780 [Austropuccinia psidii MF-1]|uniref:Uncharacterized protein n=1 Tax=Austropuccinia psidii MF-1 TaxID=1389203 RepID=A0A9Q3PWT2_9BASI|nr:hypothetical protein [Austropuccinia psidii MF-1]
MPQTLASSTELHEKTASAPKSGSEISDMVSSHELDLEVESLAHESNPDPPFLPECKGLGKRPNIHATKKTKKKRCTFEARKDSQDQGDKMINVEVGKIDNQHPHTESPPYSIKQFMMNLDILKAPPYSMQQSMMKPLLPLLEIFKPFSKGRQLNMIQWDKI